MLPEEIRKVLDLLDHRDGVEKERNENQRQLEMLNNSALLIRNQLADDRGRFLQILNVIRNNPEISALLELPPGINLDDLAQHSEEFGHFYLRVTQQLAQLTEHRRVLGLQHQQMLDEMNDLGRRAENAKNAFESSFNAVGACVARNVAAFAVGAGSGIGVGIVLTATVTLLEKHGMLVLASAGSPWILIPIAVAEAYVGYRAASSTHSSIKSWQEDPNLKAEFERLSHQAAQVEIEYNRLDAEYRAMKAQVEPRERLVDENDERLKSLQQLIAVFPGEQKRLASIERQIVFWRNMLDQANQQLQSAVFIALEQYRGSTVEQYRQTLNDFRREVLRLDADTIARVEGLSAAERVGICPLSLQVFQAANGVSSYNNIDFDARVVEQWREFCVNRHLLPVIFRGDECVTLVGTSVHREVNPQENAQVAAAAPAPAVAPVPAPEAVLPSVAVSIAPLPSAPPVAESLLMPIILSANEQAFIARITELFNSLPGSHKDREQMGQNLAQRLCWSYSRQIESLAKIEDVDKMARVVIGRVYTLLHKDPHADVDTLIKKIRSIKNTGDYSKSRLSDGRTAHDIISRPGAITPHGMHFFAHDPLNPEKFRNTKEAPRDRQNRMCFFTDTERDGFAIWPQSFATDEEARTNEELMAAGLSLIYRPQAIRNSEVSAAPAASASNDVQAAGSRSGVEPQVNGIAGTSTVPANGRLYPSLDGLNIRSGSGSESQVASSAPAPDQGDATSSGVKAEENNTSVNMPKM